MYRQKAFTLAETLITLAIIAVIVTLCIGVLNLKNIRQRDLLTRFDMSFSKLDNMTQMTMFSSQKFSDWKSDQLAMSNLTCKKEDGSIEENKSICLKKALMSVSNIPRDCDESIEECVKDYPKLANQLKEIFPSLVPEEITAFIMPGGVKVLNSYLDSSCQMDIPINKSKNGDIEYIKGCGFLLVDVNGDKKPNNLIISKKELVDRFLIALTAKGLVKSNLLSELAGCPDGTRYDSATKTCNDGFVCPVNMSRMREIEAANSADQLIKQYPMGTDRPSCYEVKCKTGAVELNNKCPAPCAAADEVRNGGLWVLEGGELPNSVSKQCCIPIYSQQDLASVQQNKNYCLMNDITIDKNGPGMSPAIGWTPLMLTGSFYGNGNIIENLYINTISNSGSGLFRQINNPGGGIENLGISNVDISCSGLCAPLAAVIYSNIKNVFTSGKVKGLLNGASNTDDFGLPILGPSGTASGLVGRGMGDTLKNLYSTVDLLGEDSTLVGLVDSQDRRGRLTISESYYKGNITNKSTNISVGLVIAALVKNSYTNAQIVSDSDGCYDMNPANIIYRDYSGDSGLLLDGIGVLNSYTIGSIKSGAYVYGIIGDNVAGAYSLSVDNSYSEMDLQGCLNSGIGRAVNTKDSYFKGSLLGSLGGGIADNQWNQPETATNVYTVVNSYSPANAPLYAKPNSSMGSNLFWDQSVNGLTQPANGGDVTGSMSLTTAQMKSAASYSSWNAAIWKIVNGFYPTHKASIMPPQAHRDCRNNANAHGGCFDVLNTQNAWDFNYVWAWKNPQKYDGKVEDPIFRWQCKPYRSNGFDCCRPSYANNEPKLESCPALSGSYTNRINY